jgi:hypothetical protein
VLYSNGVRYLMTAATAVVLLLNGIQISMPRPALLIEGRCWVPLRSIAERLGYTVIWTPDASLHLARGSEQLDVPLSKKVADTTYVPARWLDKLGVKVDYEPGKKELRLTAVLASECTSGGNEADAAGLLARILADPSAWADCSVSVEGEFLGWSVNPLCEATAFGPPVTRSDWVLRGDGGCLYCTGTVPFSPADFFGRRARVDAVVRLTRDGWPYLKVNAVEPLSGLKGLCCILQTDGFIYDKNDTVRLKLVVRNDTQEPIELVFPSGKTYDFWIMDSTGNEVWRWSADRVFTQAVVKRLLKPSEGYVVEEKVELLNIQRIREGTYYVCAELPRVTAAYAHRIRVTIQK